LLSYQEEQAWVSSMEKKPDPEFQVIKLNATLYPFIEDTDFEYVDEDVVINIVIIFSRKNSKQHTKSSYYLRI
jgi:hypothetical protein